MATTPIPSVGFDWKSLIPILELASNVTLTALTVAGVAPLGTAQLASAIEVGINPIFASIGTGSTTTSTVLAALGTMIGVLNALEQSKNLPADVLAKIEAYITAAQNAMLAYLAASKGFDARQFTPVTPIS